MEVLGAALRFVTGLPQPAVPAPVPSEIIARVATIRTARVRRRGYGLEDRERPRRVTRSMAPKVVATPAPAATGAEFGFNPVIPESAVGISRTLSANAEQQELRERRGSPKRKKTMKRTIRVKPTVDMNNIPDDILFLIMAEVAKEDPTFCRTSNRVCRRWHLISRSVPSLWSNISICSPRSYHTASLYLERSGDSPLSVYLRNLSLQDARNDPYFFDTAVALVKLYRKRITTLTLRTHTIDTLADAIGQLVGRDRAPLRTLDVSICVASPRAPSKELLWHSLPARIETLRFDRIILTNTASPRALRSLHISRPESWVNNMQTLRHIANAYPYLHKLRIDNWDNRLRPVEHDGTRDIILSELSELRLWKCRADNILLLCQHLLAPNLNLVDVAFTVVPYMPNAAGFQELHSRVLLQIEEMGSIAAGGGPPSDLRPGIETLAFSSMQSSLMELLGVLRRCDRLRSLSFTRCNITNDPVNWLGNALMSEKWLAPYLESLKIEECGAVDGLALRQFAYNRCLGADNGWITRFKELEIRGCSRVTQDEADYCKKRVQTVKYSA